MSNILEMTPEQQPPTPANLQPKNPQPKEQTENLAVAARDGITPGEVEELKSQFGLLTWSPNLVNQLHSVGFEVDRVGISRINKGALVVSQEAALIALEEMKKELTKAKTAAAKMKIAMVIVKLNESIASNVKASGVDQVATAMADNNKVLRASPAKGAPMGPPKPTVNPMKPE